MPAASAATDESAAGKPAALRDIADRVDVLDLVTVFYQRAFADPLIGRLFTEVADMKLTKHLPIMCDFWESALFHTGGYRRNTFNVHHDVHVKSPLLVEHFARWLEIWTATVDERFAGPYAERAKAQAHRIAYSMYRRLSNVRAAELLGKQQLPASRCA